MSVLGKMPLAILHTELLNDEIEGKELMRVRRPQSSNGRIANGLAEVQ